MPLIRKVVAIETYRDHKIEAKFLGPDLLAYVEGEEIAHFYINTRAAIEAGRRHIDYVIKEKEKMK